MWSEENKHNKKRKRNETRREKKEEVGHNVKRDDFRTSSKRQRP